DALPAEVVEAAHESYGARALVYCLLLDRQPSIRQQQLSLLQQRCDSVLYAMLEKLEQSLQQQDDRFLDILELTLPALKQLQGEQLQFFLHTVELLIHADNKIELLEWSLYNILLLNLMATKHSRSKLQSVAHSKILARPLGLVLSVVAHAGVYESLYESTAAKSAAKERAVGESFAAAAGVLGLAHLRPTERSAITVNRFTQALAQLNRLRPLLKPRVLKALVAAVAHDQKVRPLELQLLRAIALSLDCPMPLLHTAR
ncbi:MAG: hypothetical protein HKO07_08175, partial [Pseudomonadales bacterium]|nr:hypothetical protein [Pseudomonadales bacterium]